MPPIQCLDSIGYKLGTIIRYNGKGHAKLDEDLLPKEILYVGSRDCYERLGLHPFGVIICGCNDMRETAGGL